MLAHSLLSSSTLKDADEKKIKRVIPKASNKIIDQTVARLYVAYPHPTKWQYTGLMGALVLVDDLVGKSFFLKLVDIEGQRGVLWDQELYVDFKYYQDRTFFHSFELEECLAGLLFADKTEAAHFFKRVTQRQKYGSKDTLNNKAAIPRKTMGGAAPGGSWNPPPPPPPPSSGPQAPLGRGNSLGGGPTMGPRGDLSGLHRMRGKQIYYDGEPPVEWRSLYKDLAGMGITEDMIAANTQFIKDFINRQGGPLVGLEPPLPSRYAPKASGPPGRTASGASSAGATRAPPPPPPAPPSQTQSPTHSSSKTTSAPPPPPPAPRTSADQVEADGPAPEGGKSHFKLGGFLNRFGGGRSPSSSEPVSDANSGTETPEVPATPSPAPPAAPSSMAPPPPATSSPSGSAPPPPADTAPHTTPVLQQQGFEPPEESSPAIDPTPVRRNVPPPFPGAGSKVSETITTRTNKAPPPIPPRDSEDEAHYSSRPRPESHRSAPAGRRPMAPPPASHESHDDAPPRRPARPARPAAQEDADRPKAPPLPPTRKAVPTPAPAPPPRRGGAPPAAPPSQAEYSRPRAASPPRSRMDSLDIDEPRAPPRPTRPTSAVTDESTNVPPPAPQRPPVSHPSEAPPAAPPAAPPRPPSGPPTGQSAGPPPAPPRPSPSGPQSPPSSGSAAPPPPPLPASFGAPPPSGGSGAPPAPPPPPPSFAPPSGAGGDESGGGAPPAVLSNDLLSSITQAGIGSLKKVDKSHLERPSAVLQESRGEAPKGGAPPSGGGDLAGALAAALSARKSKVTASDDEEDEEDW